MRWLILLLSILTLSCVESGSELPIFIDDFTEESLLVHCEPLPSLDRFGGSVKELRTLNDSTLLILYDDIPKVALVGSNLEARNEIGLAQPLSLYTPISSNATIPRGIRLRGWARTMPLRTCRFESRSAEDTCALMSRG